MPTGAAPVIQPVSKLTTVAILCYGAKAVIATTLADHGAAQAEYDAAPAPLAETAPAGPTSLTKPVEAQAD